MEGHCPWELPPVAQPARTHVHADGARLDAEALVQKVTGQGLTDVDFVAYLSTEKRSREIRSDYGSRPETFRTLLIPGPAGGAR